MITSVETLLTCLSLESQCTEFFLLCLLCLFGSFACYVILVYIVIFEGTSFYDSAICKDCSNFILIFSHTTGGKCCSLDPDRGSVIFQLLTCPDNVDLTHLTSAHFQVCGAGTLYVQSDVKNLYRENFQIDHFAK